MHLKRFDEFVRELRNDSVLTGSVSAVEVIRRFNGAWYRDDGTDVEDEELIRNLANTLERDHAWRPPNEARAFFPVCALDAVVIGVFQYKPAQATRKKVHKQINFCLKRCSDAYRARHDELTALLNRSAFDSVLIDKLNEFCIASATAGEVQNEDVTQFSSIILVMLDIDFFKRVNDSYGHTYGDIVLKSFAIRLERACELLEQEKSHRIAVWCARPSGEEFAVLIAGDVTPDAELEIAEYLRSAIVVTPLPDGGELEVMSGDPKLNEIELPPIAERHVTASLGLSSRHSGIAPGGAEAAAQRLMVETDLALYRAKALGRNRCVRFCDIVHTHGQIIQHHTDVNVVAIDVGQQVGVSLGQEFLVFHPDFVGGKGFFFGDGRSERKIGDYPRVPYGRLEVFDVQSEVSFCYVAEKRGSGQFPVGARLEVVPVGSIAHLVSKEWWQWKDLQKLVPGEEDVQDELKKVEPWDTAGVACVRLSNQRKLLASRGAGFVNRVYATLCLELKGAFKRELVAQVGLEAFAVVMRQDVTDMEERLTSTVARVEDAYDSLPDLSVGLHKQRVDQPEDIYMQHGHIMHGLLFATVALELAIRQHSRLVAFDVSTPGELLRILRMNKEYGLLDRLYGSLYHSGIRSGQMESEAALAIFARGYHARALELIERAIEMEPERRNHKLNKGIYLVAAGDFNAAADIFCEVPAMSDEPPIYKAARTMAQYARYKSDPTNVDREQLLQALTEIRSYRGLLFLNVRSFDVVSALVQVKAESEAPAGT